ncbi:portal protein [Mycobacterium sp. KBS0706]|nr:portal protein [Mycobacterium sp. KBS0706]
MKEAEQRRGITYRGVWKAGDFYAAGHVVTHEGSGWHANSETKSRPGQDRSWTLMVKRGRDGRK